MDAALEYAPVGLDYRVIERAMLAMPQTETPTVHTFAEGLYVRQMRAAAGTIVLGRVHRGSTLNILMAGKCVLLGEDGSTVGLSAPETFVSPPGRKLAYVIEDMIWLNVWATDKTDVDALEQELFVMGPSA